MVFDSPNLPGRAGGLLGELNFYNMKKILFAALAFAAFFSAACSKSNEEVDYRSNQEILVRFQNSTDSPIEESAMTFDGASLTDVGSIPAGETTDYIVFDYFEVGYYEGGDYQFPVGSLNGKKDGGQFSAWSGNWCGTGVSYKQLEPGEYTLQIVATGVDVPFAYVIDFVE